MKKWRIIFRESYTPSPLSFWVHKNLDSEIWSKASKFKPSLAKAIPGKGYPILVVSALDVELKFSSIDEAAHFLEIICQKNMPTSKQLSKKRKVSTVPNSHWLSRLPARIKPWSKREKIIPIIKDGIAAFKALYL